MIGLLILLRFVSAFNCGAHEHQERYPPKPYPPRDHARKLSTYSTRKQEWEPIRVHFEYIDDLNGFSAQQFATFRDDIMFFVQKHLETSLLVQRRKDDSPIKIECDDSNGNPLTQCDCMGQAMPEYITSTGVPDADVVMITYTGTDSNSSWVARAGACWTDSTHFGNPIVGSVEINLAVWDFDDPYENQHGVMIHEVYHALGMSGSTNLMADWVSDEQGTKRGQENISREYTNSQGVDVFRIITPKVAEKAQEIYGCNTLDGVDMENQGGSGTLGSHWEKRIISDDFMTGHIGWHDPTYSAITLAFMEDSGWYKAVWERAMVQVWGNGEGCSFLDDTCINISTKQSNFPDFFCTELDYSINFCDHNHLQVGYCDRSDGQNPDAKFDYFGDGSAGTDSLMDGCPVVTAYSNKNCRNINQTPYNASNYIGEVTGPNSRCVTGTLMPPNLSVSTGRGLCVEVKECQSDRAVLRLQAMAATSSNSNTGHDEVEFECLFTGGQVTPSGWVGAIDCPASSILCDEVPCMNFCHGLGNCVNSLCVCDQGWGGDDCGIQCNSACYNCSGTAADNCTTCATGYELSSGTCVSIACPTGKFAQNDVCVDCNSPCTECETTADTCTACDSAKRLSSNQCVDSCPSGTVDDGTYCTSCTGSQLTYNGNCVDVCPSGSYATTESCIDCHINCEECFSNTETTCSSCKTSGSLPYLSGTSCVASCTSNQVLLNAQCQDCTGDCLTCETATDYCLTCKDNKKQQTGTCVTACAQQFIDNNDVCEPCTSPCATCTVAVTDCTSCISGKVLDIITCLEACPDGKYADSANLCQVCHGDCATCVTSLSNCLTCSNSKKLYNNTCVDSCPEGSVESQGGDVCTACASGQKVYQGACVDGCTSTQFELNSECLDCSPPCLGCSSYSVCTSCSSSGQYPYLNGTDCVDACPSGMYYDSGTSSCTDCNSACATCVDTATKCLTCNSGLKAYDNGCVTTCPDGTYDDSDVCIACSSPCATCVTSPATCLTCEGSLLLDGGQYCIENCVANVKVAVNGACEDCQAPCAECSGTPDTCTKCESGMYLSGTDCQSGCADGEFIDINDNCTACSSECATCTGSATSCLTCPTGKFRLGTLCLDACPLSMIALNGLCENCNSPCATCEANQDTCTSCLDAAKYSHNGFCMSACPYGYTGVGTKCEACASPCVTCDGSSINCLICSGSQVMKDGACIDACDAPEIDVDGACVSCSANCATCQNDPAECLTCSSGSFLDGTTCVDGCPVGKYNNAEVCEDCTSPCAACDGGPTACTACESGQKLSSGACVTTCPGSTTDNGTSCTDCTGSELIYQGTCVDSQPAGTYEDNGEYLDCNVDCATCNSATECLTCRSDGLKPFQKGTECLAECPRGEYADSNNQCAACTSPCETCSGTDTTCNSCISGKVFSVDECLDACLAGKFEQDDVCEPCVSPCTECTGKSTSCTVCESPLLLSGTACVDSCTAPLIDVNSVCTACDSSCATCDVLATSCTSCVSPAVLENSQCVSSCSNDKFQDVNGVCQPCVSPCVTCVGSSTACTSCQSGLNLVGTTCESACPSGQSLVNDACVVCTPPCLSCSVDVTTCDSCLAESQVLLSGDCVDQCPSDYFLDGIICVQCTTGCATCENSATNCLTCSSGYKKQENSCLTACTTGTYIDINDICTPCDSSCATCQNTINTCATCSGSLNLEGTECVSNCPSGKYASANVCYDCTSPCEECEGSATTCTKCESPKKLYQGGCVDTCPSNSIDAGEVCQTCPNGQKMYKGICQDACPTNTYENQYQECLDCPVGCATCTSDTVCTTCEVRKYLDTNTLCSDCYVECLTCVSNGSDQCTSCDISHQLLFTDNTQTLTGLCVCNTGWYWSSIRQECREKPNEDSCDGSTYFDEGTEVCLPCHSDCVECNGSAQNQCTYCPYDRKFVQDTSAATSAGIQGNCNCYAYADQASNVCQSYDCASGFYLDTTEYGKEPVCRTCHATCATCASSSNESACTSCPENREITTGNYKDVCTCKTEYLDTSTGECLTSPYVNSSSYCPLTEAQCNQVNSCNWNSFGVLISPISDDCVVSLYEWCCFDAQKALCNNIGITFNQCDQLNPQPISAKFNKRGDRIKVKFDKAIIVNHLITTCSQIFADWNEYGADCYVQIVNSDAARKKIFIDLYCGQTGQINVGDKIKFNPDVFKSISEYDDGRYNTDQPELTLEAPNTVSSVKIRVQAPSIISNCEAELYIDASNSKGAACTGLTYQWSFVGLTADLPALGNYNSWDGIMYIPQIYYQASPGITVTLTASNRLGATATKTFTIAVQATSVPVVEFAYDTIVINRGQDLDLEIFPKLSTCSVEGVSPFTYKFEAISDPTPSVNTNWNSLFNNFNFEKRILTIPANTLSSGNTYTIRASASTSTSQDGYGHADLNIEVEGSPLEISVANGNRIISSDTAVTLSAQNSRDPDDTDDDTSQSDWAWRWTCEDWTSFGETNPLYGNGVDSDQLDEDYVAYYQEFVPGQCLGATSALMSSITTNADTLAIPANQIPEGSLYYFMATATKDSRSSSGYAWLQPFSGLTNSVTIRQESRYLNSTDINTLFADVVSDNNYILQWDVENEGTSLDFLNPTSKTELAFDGNQLKPETVYKFTCTLRQGLETLISSTEMTINSPPINGNMQISPQTGTINTDFSVSFLGWEDREENYPLVYKIIIVPENPNEAPQVKTWSFSNVIQGLNFPAVVSNSTQTIVTIRGEIYDIYGSKAETAEQRITMDTISTTEACDEAYNTVIDWNDNHRYYTYKQQLDLLTQAASLSKECGYDESLISQIETIVDTMDINEMTFDELEQYSTYFGVTSQASSASLIKNNLNSMMTKMSNLNRTPSLSFLQNLVQTACKLGLWSSGTEQQEEDTLKQVGDLALNNRITDVEAEIPTDNAKINYVKKATSDLKTEGFSKTIEGVDNTSGTSRLRRRLSATNPNKYHTIDIPTEYLQLDDEEYTTQTQVSQGTNDNMSNGGTRATLDFKVKVRDARGNTISILTDKVPEEQSCITYTYGLFDLDEYSEYEISTQTPWTYGSTDDEFYFQCESTDNDVWTSDGFDQTKTLVNWEDKTVSCCALKLLDKTAVTFNKVTIVYSDEYVHEWYAEDDDDSDDYEKLDQFSPFYLSLILICVCAIIVFLENLRDCGQDPRTKLVRSDFDPEMPSPKLHIITDGRSHKSSNVEDTMQKQNQSMSLVDATRAANNSMNRSGSIEVESPSNLALPSQVESPASIWNIQKHERSPVPVRNKTGIPEMSGKDDTDEGQGDDCLKDIKDANKPAHGKSCCSFMWDFSILGLLFGENIIGFYRGALIAMIFGSVQGGILICPFIIEEDFTFYYAGLISAALVAPLDAILSGLIIGAKDAVTMCKIVVYIVVFGVQGACLGLTWYYNEDYGETMNHDWMMAGGVAAGCLLFVIHPITLAVKYAIYSCQGKPSYE